jgi:EF hand domain-containing protein
MRARNPLITAVVLSLAMTGPTLAAAWDSGSNGSYEQDQSKKKPNRGRGNNGGNNGGNQGEDLTRMRFYGLDTNRDGRITRDEWRGNQNSFNQHDWNGDGVLSGIEVTPGAQRPGTGDAFDRLDFNRDGRISLSEWNGDRTTFDRLDLNDDGFLTREELRNKPQGQGSRFDLLDRNDDGRISLAEWPGNQRAFDRLDRNDDGFLSPQEFARGGEDDD